MKRQFYLLIALASIATLTSIDCIRKALLFDTQIAYAADEIKYGWMIIGGEEVFIQFGSALTDREISVKEFCEIYGFSYLSGKSVTEQWCEQKEHSLCEMRFVGAFLNYENGGYTKLTVVPEYMYY